MKNPMQQSRRPFTALVAAIGACAAAAPAPLEDAEAATTTDQLDDLLLREVNAARRQHGLPPVRNSSALDRAATARSRDMATRGYFGHTLPGGKHFSKRVLRCYPAVGYRTWKVGENLFWSVAARDAGFVVRAWLSSAAHRRVLLYPHWDDAGIGALRADAAPGFFGNRAVTIVAVEFGTRRR